MKKIDENDDDEEDEEEDKVGGKVEGIIQAERIHSGKVSEQQSTILICINYIILNFI